MQEPRIDLSESTTVRAVSESSRTHKNLNQFSYSVTFLSLVAMAAGLVLAGYVLFVGNRINSSRQIDRLSIAALDAVSTLKRVTVESPSFGDIGLCDLESEDSKDASDRLYSQNGNAKSALAFPVMGINHLHAQLRLLALLAEKIRHPLISAHLTEDFNEAAKLESALLTKVYQTKRTIYENAYKTLTKSRTERAVRLESLQISFGCLKEPLGDSQIKAPPSTDSVYVNKEGQYRAGIVIPSSSFPPITFNWLASRTVLVDPAQFIAYPLACGHKNPTAVLSAPSAVLIEAVYQIKHKGKELQKIKKAACAALGCKQTPTSPEALLVTFPQGMPEVFHSLNEIMFYKHWNKESIWCRAANGDVPGSGSLTSLMDAKLPAMTPGDAMALIIYHWFKLVPTDIDLRRCQDLLSCNLIDLKRFQDTLAASSLDISDATGSNGRGGLKDMESPLVNSCLLRDSSGRAAALLDKATPGGRGQWAISQIFNKTDCTSTINPAPVPPSALPLFVDATGNCNLVGCVGFEEPLIEQFFNSVYETNLCSFETLSTAQLLREKFYAELQQTQQKMVIAREELNSIEHRLRALNDKATLAPTAQRGQLAVQIRQSELFTERSNLNQGLTQAEHGLARLNHLIQLSSIAIENATKTADETYELTAHLFSMCREGLIKLPSSKEHYVIGKKFLFTPLSTAVSELDFIEADRARHGPEARLAKISPWFKKDLALMKELDLGLAQNDPIYKAMLGKVMSIQNLENSQRSMQPVTFVFNSHSLVHGNSSSPATYSDYPFVNTVIPSGQLFYYCQQAVTTGANPKVSWSVLARDVVAFKLKGVSGQPIKANDLNWCHQRGEAGAVCPGLACEFQLRAPLPQLDSVSLGSYIRNRAHHLVPQLPPVPAEML